MSINRRSTSPAPSTASSSSAFTHHNQPNSLASQLGRAKAHNLVLKNALVEHRQRINDLSAQLIAKETTIRANTHSIDAIKFHNSNLSRRIEHLQSLVAQNQPNTPRRLGLFSGLIGRSSSSQSDTDPSSAAATELSTTRDLLETTAQELERRITHTELLQSKLNEFEANKLAEQSLASIQRDRAVQELEQTSIKLSALQVKVEERDRLAEELARVIEHGAKLQNDLLLRDKLIQDQNNAMLESQTSVNSLLDKFTSSAQFRALTSASVLANLRSSIEYVVHDLILSIHVLVSQLLTVPQKKEDAVYLTKLNRILSKCPFSFTSTTSVSRRDFLMALIHVHNALVPSADSRIFVKLKHGLSRGDWDPECTLAFLNQLFAHILPSTSSKSQLSNLCNHGLDCFSKLTHYIETYRHADQLADHIQKLSPTDLLQFILNLTASIGNVHCEMVRRLSDSSHTKPAETQVVPSDVISFTHRHTQVPAVERKMNESQTVTSSAQKSVQTEVQSTSGLWISRRSMRREDGVLQESPDTSDGEAVDKVSAAPEYANEVQAVREYFAAQVTQYARAAHSATERAEIAETNRDAVIATMTTKAKQQAHAYNIQVRTMQSKLDLTNSKLNDVHLQLQEAKDKARDTEDSYMKQLQVLTEEVCRLQAQFSSSSNS